MVVMCKHPVHITKLVSARGGSKISKVKLAGGSKRGTNWFKTKKKTKNGCHSCSVRFSIAHLFAGVEADVFQEHDVTVAHGRDSFLDRGPDAVVHLDYLFTTTTQQ